MNLGFFLPQEMKDDFAKRNIELGKTLLIEIPDFNIAYKKYLIIIAINDSHIAGVVINTEINLNFAWSEEIKKLHLPIKQQEHPFLKYDSFVDCTKLHKKPIVDICNAIKENPNIVVGNVTDSFLKTLQITITYAKTISIKDKKDFGF